MRQLAGPPVELRRAWSDGDNDGNRWKQHTVAIKLCRWQPCGQAPKPSSREVGTIQQDHPRWARMSGVVALASATQRFRLRYLLARASTTSRYRRPQLARTLRPSWTGLCNILRVFARPPLPVPPPRSPRAPDRVASINLRSVAIAVNNKICATPTAQAGTMTNSCCCQIG